MAYEIDFVGAGDKVKQDADAICFRWKAGEDSLRNPIYKVGVYDGGFEAHGEAMTKILNQYYFDDPNGQKDASDKVIDFICISHTDQDHTVGITHILENFAVKKIYMNRPWVYSEELRECVIDRRINLRKHLREAYTFIADIEDCANEKGIPIYEAFEGTEIEDSFRILSPTKDFYLQLICEANTDVLEPRTSFLEQLQHSPKTFAAKTLTLTETWTHEELREDVYTTPENESSVILLGTFDDERILLTGDAGIRALDKAIDYATSIGVGLSTKVDFYQIPHHGGRHNVSPSILDRLLGSIQPEGTIPNRSAFASSAKGSDHPYKIVTNAFLRRGVKSYSNNDGSTIHHYKDMPTRNWSSITNIPFTDHVEEWSD